MRAAKGPDPAQEQGDQQGVQGKQDVGHDLVRLKPGKQTCTVDGECQQQAFADRLDAALQINDFGEIPPTDCVGTPKRAWLAILLVGR
jgi:hypothetical protein